MRCRNRGLQRLGVCRRRCRGTRGEETQDKAQSGVQKGVDLQGERRRGEWGFQGTLQSPQYVEEGEQALCTESFCEGVQGQDRGTKSEGPCQVRQRPGWDQELLQRSAEVDYFPVICVFFLCVCLDTLENTQSNCEEASRARLNWG